MEKRLVLALFLSLLVIIFFNYNALKKKEYEEAQKKNQQEEMQPSQEAEISVTPTLTVQAESDVISVTPEHELGGIVKAEIKNVTYETKDYQIVLSSKGGNPVSWKLKQYPDILANEGKLRKQRDQFRQDIEQQRRRGFSDAQLGRMLIDFNLLNNRLNDYDRIKKESRELKPEIARLRDEGSIEESEVLLDKLHEIRAIDLIPLDIFGNVVPPLSLDLESLFKGVDPIYEVSENVSGLTDEIIFSQTFPNGLKVEKIYSFGKMQYTCDLAIRFSNTSEQTIIWPGNTATGRIKWDGGLVKYLPQDRMKNYVMFYRPPGKSKQYYFSAVNKKIKNGENRIGFEEPWIRDISWAAVESRYFIAAFVPHQPISDAELTSDMEGRSGFILEFPVKSIPPNSSVTNSFTLYVGPKMSEPLKQLGVHLDNSIFIGTLLDWIHFTWICHLVLALLELFHKVIPNYGIAIILLTILTKILLYPLTRKQIKSMRKMQAFQPEMAKIREKYKDNAQEMNKKTMEFYRKHGVNPMGGCLPMLPTIPVFIALYITIDKAIQLRGAPFFGWITDLSQPDTIALLSPVALPVLGYVPINPMPLVYGIFTFVQQKYLQKTPMTDPNQKTMMTMMPIVFVFIFYNFASGLVLYWLLNSVIQAIQQIIIEKTYKPEVPNFSDETKISSGKTDKVAKLPYKTNTPREKKKKK